MMPGVIRRAFLYPHNLLLQSYLMSFKSGETFSELAPPLSKVFHKWQDGTQGIDTCIFSNVKKKVKEGKPADIIRRCVSSPFGYSCLIEDIPSRTVMTLQDSALKKTRTLIIFYYPVLSWVLAGRCH